MATPFTQKPQQGPTREQALLAARQSLAAALVLLDMEIEEDRRRTEEPAPAAGDDVLTPKEVAAELKVSRGTVFNLIKSGRLRAEEVKPRLYRITRSELNAYRRRISRQLRRIEEAR